MMLEKDHALRSTITARLSQNVPKPIIQINFVYARRFERDEIVLNFEPQGFVKETNW